MKPKVLVTSHEVPQCAIDLLKEDCEVDVYEHEIPIPQDVLRERIKGKEGLLCLLTDKVDKDIIESAGPDLKVIATMSVGFDHIDIQTCREKKIPVSNTPEVSTDSVAELTVALMLAVGRRLFEASRAIKNGKWTCPWRPVWLCGQGVHGSTVGIIGMGRIGRGVMERLLPFGVAKVLYYDVYHPIKPAEAMGAIFAPFEELLQQCDFVICMCNLSEETKEMFNKKAFSLMKKSAIFINTARGGLVNQDDLYEALKNGEITAAGLDTMIPEPLPRDHPLTTLPNIVLTPHIGSAELNVRNDMAKLAATNITTVLTGGKIVTPVY